MRTETFQTPGPVRTEIRLGSGGARLSSGEEGQTIVTLEPLRDNDSTREAIANARIELRERAGEYEVVVDVRDRGRGFSIGRGADVRVEIRCPDGTDVEAKSGSADIEGRGRFGSLDVGTGSGDVQFETIDREARANAASGDVVLDSVGGNARINTAPGDQQPRPGGGGPEPDSDAGGVGERSGARGVWGNQPPP